MVSRIQRRLANLERSVRRRVTLGTFMTRGQEHARLTGVTVGDALEKLTGELSDEDLDRLIEESKRRESPDRAR